MLGVHYKEYELLDGTKKILLERISSGQIIKRFDKTPLPKEKTDVVCPHFLEFKWSYGCKFNPICDWCYLQGTLRRLPSKTQPRIKDITKIKRHLETFLEHTDYQEILNTGEISDSLNFEKAPKKALSNIVREYFDSPANKENHIALLVTKDGRTIENLIKKPIDHAIISYSLNGSKVAKMGERGAPSTVERIKALEKLEDAGYTIRIRIDPMVPIPGWTGSYWGLIDKVYRKLEPERITIGSLRGLKTTLIWSKNKWWVKYLDKGEKTNFGLRINFDQRARLYEYAIGQLKSYGANKIALCKETTDMWKHLGLDYKKITCNCIL